MKKIYNISLIFGMFASTFSQTQPPSNITQSENYVYTREYLTETSASNNTLPQIQSVTYFDGLGRPKQNIAIKASPADKDVVTKIEYNALGRQDKDFLPMPQTGTTNGAMYSSVSEAVGIPLYGGVAPFFAKNEIENSPLNRPLSATAPGVWSASPNTKVTFQYRFNVANEVKKYTAALNTSTFANTLNVSGTYTVNQLYKNIITDEDGNVSIEFKDKLGQTVLIRKAVSNTENADTYYVYNEFHDLAFVISPLASAKTSLTQTDLDELCYQYKYDGRNRLVEKKIPGKGWEFMVYDKQDRLVMMQDANMNTNGEWLFTKYDQYGRVVYTGTTQNTNSRSSLQTIMNTKGSNNVARTASVGFTNSGLSVYYDNDSAKNYPNSITKLLSVNYYDKYPTDAPAVSTLGFSQTFITDNAQGNNISTKSLPVASYVNNVETNAWTKTYPFYDNKGRPIAAFAQNHLGGYTKTESILDFVGVPQKTYTKHKRLNTDSETVIVEDFVYDSQNRLTKHFHTVNNHPKERLAFNQYNELGQLVWKQTGGDEFGNNYLQIAEYQYNIRGWLRGVNLDANGNVHTDKIFSYKINYNEPLSGTYAGVTPRFNGNIAEVLWSSEHSAVKKYGYQYDGLNRLLAGIYHGQTPNLNEYFEKLTYDLNGNIKTLKRTSYFNITAASLIDDLVYNYTGNRVTNIDDLSLDPNGYEGGNFPIS
ncbi:MAG: DUF6443 domain-containing protein, partial [Flavobacteriaceae bacterium]|nr:DUF6443 domain-containing protein [Flavobacteriaceae bacterium]